MTDLYTSSPFIYHNGQVLHLENEKTTCTYDEIATLTARGHLKRTDFDIFDILYEFQCLNRHNILFALKSNFERSGGDPRNNIKKNLAKLVKFGMIMRYSIQWGETDTPTRTPCFYTLSPGMHSFYNRKRSFSLKKKQQYFSTADPVEMLHVLCLNQFHIRFTSQYDHKIKKSLRMHPITIFEQNQVVDGLYRLTSTEVVNGFDLAVLVIRRNPHWQQIYVERLASLYAYCSKKPHIAYEPLVITICEDDLHMKEAFLVKNKEPSVRNIYTLYASDLNLLSDAMLDELFEFEEVIDEDSNAGRLNDLPVLRTYTRSLKL